MKPDILIGLLLANADPSDTRYRILTWQEEEAIKEAVQVAQRVDEWYAERRAPHETA